MNEITEAILQKRIVVDAEGKEYPLHSHTSREQGEFLGRLVREIGATTCIEVGLAYGISSLFIAEAMSESNAPRFISIDPQQDYWHNIGLLNLERAGYRSFVEFHRDWSHCVLPKLFANNERIDFAYVDTTKVFDVVLLDAYYLTRLLRVGGLLAFDDCRWSGVQRMIRYISKWPHLVVADRYGVYRNSWKWLTLSRLIRIAPKKERVFSDSLLVPDEELGTNAHCVVFRKVAEDERNWDWTCNF